SARFHPLTKHLIPDLLLEYRLSAGMCRLKAELQPLTTHPSPLTTHHSLRMFWTLLILRYSHILSAITLMGGTMFAYFAASPGLAELPEAGRMKAHAAIRQRWNKFVMLTTLLLLVSGLATMVLVPKHYDLGEMKGAYHMWTGIKFMLALPIFFFA